MVFDFTSFGLLLIYWHFTRGKICVWFTHYWFIAFCPKTNLKFRYFTSVENSKKSLPFHQRKKNPNLRHFYLIFLSIVQSDPERKYSTKLRGREKKYLIFKVENKFLGCVCFHFCFFSWFGINHRSSTTRKKKKSLKQRISADGNKISTHNARPHRSSSFSYLSS